MIRYGVRDVEKWILYEDADILLVHKPAGLAVQNASFSQQDLESLLRNRLKGGYLGVVHRLDQPVEGLILFAKTPWAASELGKQVSGRAMCKEYAAVVCLPEREIEPIYEGESWQRLEDWLVKDTRSNLSRVVSQDTPGAKLAVLDYHLLERNKNGDRALLEVRLQTGRHHQIRVQLAHAGMPLAGDRKYGSPVPAGVSLALCAVHLSFHHPRTGRPVSFSIVPEGDAFKENLWTKFGKRV